MFKEIKNAFDLEGIFILMGILFVCFVMVVLSVSTAEIFLTERCELKIGDQVYNIENDKSGVIVDVDVDVDDRCDIAIHYGGKDFDEYVKEYKLKKITEQK